MSLFSWFPAFQHLCVGYRQYNRTQDFRKSSVILRNKILLSPYSPSLPRHRFSLFPRVRMSCSFTVSQTVFESLYTTTLSMWSPSLAPWLTAWHATERNGNLFEHTQTSYLALCTFPLHCLPPMWQVVTLPLSLFRNHLICVVELPIA